MGVRSLAVLGCLSLIFVLLAAVIYYVVRRSSKKKQVGTGQKAQYPQGYVPGPTLPPQQHSFQQGQQPKPEPEQEPEPMGASVIYEASDFVPNPPMQRSAHAHTQAAESQQQQNPEFKQPQTPPWELEDPQDDSGIRTCAACSADNSGTLPTCWRCGQKLESKAAARSCPECGTPREPLADHCPKCGARLVIT